MEKAVLVKQIQERCDILTSVCDILVVELPLKKQLIIAFRGTKSLSQFFFEGFSFFFPKSPYFDIGSVNYYFNTAHNYIWPQIDKILRNPTFKNHNIVLTGHSLGGSLATLTAARIILEKIHNRNNTKLLTFAEPRTGDFIFAKNLDKMLKYKFRVVNRADLLVHVPPCHKDFSFMPKNNLPCDPRSRNSPYHYMKEIWYSKGMDQNSSYIVCDGSQGEDKFCSSSQYITFRNLSKSLRDHRKYFGFMVAQYGKAGCDENREYNDSEGFLGMISYFMDWINTIFF